MYRRLERIADLPERAALANGSVRALAGQCGVSPRTLERYIKRQFGECAHVWLAQQRMQRAKGLMLNGSSVKEAAFESGFKNPYHFSREFKKCYGYAPSRARL